MLRFIHDYNCIVFNVFVLLLEVRKTIELIIENYVKNY